MKEDFVNQFFRELDKNLKAPGEIILTGAVAWAIFGHVRPTRDIDFEIRLKSKSTAGALPKSIQITSSSLATAVQYSEDRSRWSDISYLDYRKTAEPYKRIGGLNVKTIVPEHWTIR